MVYSPNLFLPGGTTLSRLGCLIIVMLQSSIPSANPGPMRRQAEAIIPTPWGRFNMIAYAESADEWMPHIALVSEKTPDRSEQPIIVRLHSECMTGDLFGSKRCDCGEQLDQALQIISEKGGILLYLRQEGRGIGLINKLKAYQLQDKGLDTVEANVHLGLEIDARQYDIALDMLRDLNVKRIHLLTNNPEKIVVFDRSDIEIVDRLPIVIPPQAENESYLRTKREQMGHLYDLIRTR